MQVIPSEFGAVSSQASAERPVRTVPNMVCRKGRGQVAADASERRPPMVIAHGTKLMPAMQLGSMYGTASACVWNLMASQMRLTSVASLHPRTHWGSPVPRNQDPRGYVVKEQNLPDHAPPSLGGCWPLRDGWSRGSALIGREGATPHRDVSNQAMAIQPTG